jgi:hypothetical protein
MSNPVNPAHRNLAQLTRPPKAGPNRAARRAAMQAQPGVPSQFGARNDARRKEAQVRAHAAILAREEAAREQAAATVEG